MLLKVRDHQNTNREILQPCTVTCTVPGAQFSRLWNCASSLQVCDAAGAVAAQLHQFPSTWHWSMRMMRRPSARTAFSSFCICEAVQHGVHPCRVFSIMCITRKSVQRHLRTSSTTTCRPRTLAFGHMLGDRGAKVIPERQPVKVETKRADAARKQLCSGVFSVLRYRDCSPWAKVGSRRCARRASN